MKNKVLLMVLALALVFAMAGCKGNDAGTADSVTYKGKGSDGKDYSLTITKAAGRAITPMAGDTYVLTVAGTPASKGTVESGNAVDGFALKPDGKDKTINVLVDGTSIAAIAGGAGTGFEELFVSFGVISGGTPISGDTLANGATVVYDSTLADKAAAQKITDFGYVLSPDGSSLRADAISTFVDGSPEVKIPAAK